MYRIKTLRGTVFCPPIRFTKEFVNDLSGTIDGYLPILVRDSNTLPIFQVWQLSSPDEKELLAFNGDKIDLIQVVEAEVDDDLIHSFSERCQAVFGRILEITGAVCTRIALAPTVIITENGERPSELFDRLFNVREFASVQLDSSNFSQVYRVDRSIGGSVIKINHVASFKAENELISTANGNQLRLRYMCDFDVNSMPHPEYRFNSVGINDFYRMAPDFFADFYRIYFAE